MKKFIGITSIVLLSGGLLYFSGVGFYAEKFSANTNYGTVDISNLTFEEAQAKIIEDTNDKEIKFTEDGKTIATMQLGDLEPDYQRSMQLETTYASQDPIAWINGFFEENQYETSYEDTITIPTEQLEKVLSSHGIDNDERQEAINAEIIYDEDTGYAVQEGERGTIVDYELLADEIASNLDQDVYEIELSEAYILPEVMSDSEGITDYMDAIESVRSADFTYELASQEIAIPALEIEKWIYFNEANEIVLDRESVTNYLHALNEEHATMSKDRQFESTLQGQVTVPPGILGWSIDVETETDELIKDILSGKAIKREPALISSGGLAGEADDIGDTYVEIDLTYQTMYLYVDGELIVETPIVSGQVGAETVPGANAVNEMLANTNLVGYNQFYKVDYSVPVSYWIRFDNQAQGIHDASWQGSFGGDTYLYSGSLGCINTPYGAVETIYNNVDYGTPVIVFY